ncbi:MAG: COX15/CtaA family protein [Verrucomicrobiia bacterium]
MSSESNVIQKSTYKPVLFWGGLITLIWITFLLYAGGFTTSIRAGMAFLDWPLSNGSINPEGWLENDDMMAEHSHRLLGMVMGLLSIGLCVAAFSTKARPQIRKLGIALVVLVVVQGLLGGLRVKLDALNLDIDHNLYAQSFAVAHGTLAQLFLCSLVAFAIMSSRSWIERNAGFIARPKSSVATAIPTFPLTPYGTLIPPAFNFQVAIHFTHRVGALVVTIAIVTYVIAVFRDPASRRALGVLALVLAALLVIQGYLGALVIWTVRNPHVATMHMLNGAFVLAFCWMMTLRSLKFRLDPSLLASRQQDRSESTTAAEA